MTANSKYRKIVIRRRGKIRAYNKLTFTNKKGKKKNFFPFFHNIRFITSVNWHQRATRFKWYKKWHDFKFSHHFHFLVFAVYLLSVFFAIFAPQREVQAALVTATKSITTKAQFDQGTFAATKSTNVADGEIQLGNVSSLSNSGGSPWLYRKEITLNNTGGSLYNNYQLELSIDTLSLISQGKMQSNGADIRFTDSDGLTEISHWLDTGINTNDTNIKVKIPSIAANSTKAIYFYYGNATATSTSNNSVFSINSYSQTSSYVPGGVTTLPVSYVRYAPVASKSNQILIGEGADYPGDYHIVNESNGSLLYSLTSPSNRGRGTDWNHDGSKVAIGGGGGSSAINIHSWNGSAWSLGNTIPYPGYYDAQVFFSPNGAYLSVTWTSQMQTRVYRTTDFTMIKNFGNVGYAKFNNDNSRVAIYSGTTITLYNSTNADPAAWSSVGSVTRSFYDYKFSKDGNYFIVTVPSENKIYVYNSNDFSLYKTIDTPGRQAGAISISRTNNNVFLASYNGYAKMATFDLSKATPLLAEFGDGSANTYYSPSFNYNDTKVAATFGSTTLYVFSGTYSSGSLPISFGTESGTYGTSGSYTSSGVIGGGVLDLFWNGGWGSGISNLESNVTLPAGTTIVFEGRVSNDASAWSGWANLGSPSSTGLFQSLSDGSNPFLSLPVQRYLQIRVNFTGDGSATPVVSDITIKHLTDLNAPSNPTTAVIYSDNQKNTIINNNSWGSDSALYLEWPAAEQPGGATDNSESGVSKYHVYFGADATAVPMTAGVERYVPNIETTIDSADSGKTFYLRIQTVDEAGNITPVQQISSLLTYRYDVTRPTNPSFIEKTPVGWTTVDNFTFNWGASPGQDLANGFGNSGVCSYLYTTSDSNKPLSEWTETTETTVSGPFKYKNGENIFYLKTKDCAGNISVGNVLSKYYFSQDAPSKPQNLTVSPNNNSENSFTFSWDKPATYNDSIREYRWSVNSIPSEGNSVVVSASADHMEIGPISAATQQGLNTFYVVAIDSLGNVSYDSNHFSSIEFECNTPAPGIPINPEIFDTSNRDLQKYSVALSWTEPEFRGVGFSGYIIERSDNGVEFSQVGSGSSTSFVDVNLESRLYYYRVKAKDNSGNSSAPSQVVSKTPTGRYTSPPNITHGPEVSAKVSTANIRWFTDREASSFVEIGETGAYGLTQGQFEFATDHKVLIERLKPNTTYHYRVKYVDIDGNIGYSQDQILKTAPAPYVTNLKIEDIRLNSAVISWNTTAPAKSDLMYGKSSLYGENIPNVTGGFTTSHAIRLTNLTHSSKYFFRVKINDLDENEILSDEYSFETLKYPTVSNIRMEPLRDQSTATMKFTWDSNVPTTSIVEYSPDGGRLQEAVKSKLETKHELVVPGLMDNTFYVAKIIGRDQFGNEAISDSQRFKTDFDTRPPRIFNITTESSLVGFGADARGQLIVSWETDEAASSQVEYSVGSSGGYNSKTQEDNSYATSHLVIISDLKTSSPYHFRVVSKDQSGNISYSDDSPVLSEQASESVIDLVIKSLQSTIGWIFSAFAQQ